MFASSCLRMPDTAPLAYPAPKRPVAPLTYFDANADLSHDMDSLYPAPENLRCISQPISSMSTSVGSNFGEELISPSLFASPCTYGGARCSIMSSPLGGSTSPFSDLCGTPPPAANEGCGSAPKHLIYSASPVGTDRSFCEPIPQFPVSHQQASVSSERDRGQRKSAKMFGASEARRRKVFVGGVPQEMDDAEFLSLFSSIARVDQAWLQRSSDVSSMLNHRGFGFVVFHESSSVDMLLGSHVSGYLCLGGDRRLEIKRAIRASKLADGPSATGGGNNAVSFREQAQPAAPRVSQRDTCNHLPWLSCVPSTTFDPPQLAALSATTNASTSMLVSVALGAAHGPALTAHPGTAAYYEQVASLLYDAMPDRYDD